VERVSTAFATAKKRAGMREPILATSITDWFASEQKADAEPEPAPAPGGDTSEAPITWLLDEPGPAGSETFLLRGANVSDQPLEDVQAVLKPDTGAKDFDLVLQLEGGPGEVGAVIPPGARFNLAAETLTNDAAKRLGGAILSFGYVQAGRRKTSIMYLTPPMLAQGAARD
jgi:hypothetical protein